MKRRSGLPQGHSQPEETVFFIDECLGKQVAQALKEAGAKVEVHTDHFDRGTKDTEWIPVVAKNKWIILSKDKHIRTRQLEREAILTNDARAFFLTKGNMTGPDMADTFVKNLNKIKKVVQKKRPPFIATVNKSGVKVEK